MKGDVGEIDTSGTMTLAQWHRAREQEAEQPIHVVRWTEKTSGGVGSDG